MGLHEFHEAIQYLVVIFDKSFPTTGPPLDTTNPYE